jgi:hypothetical protein
MPTTDSSPGHASGRQIGKDARQNARQRDDVGDDLPLEIDHRDGDERGQQRRGDAGVQGRAEGQRGGAEERAGDGLDDRIPPGDRHAARAAAAAQGREGDKRDVVVPGDRAPTARTRRARPPHAASLGHAGDDDVQEAPDQEAGDDERGDDHALSGALRKCSRRPEGRPPGVQRSN